jgi:hypothetical protein
LRRARPRDSCKPRALARPVEQPLAASADGEVLIAAEADGACCGWDNEGSDRMFLFRNGTESVLYDEFSRYGNRNYDVSFFVANARLGAGDTMLAYTIASTSQPGGEIRLSSSGREDAAGLARVREALAGLPAVEVVDLGVRPAPPVVIRSASLVGWLNDREILVARNGRLAVYDARGTLRIETDIRVRSGADAFLR